MDGRILLEDRGSRNSPDKLAALHRHPNGAVHLYGHLHARGDPAPRRRDVGVDAIGFAPRRLDWLLEDLAADSSD